MSVAVAHLLEETLRLPLESQTDLVEPLLKRAHPSKDLLDHQLGIVAQRVVSVRQGTSALIDAEDAHTRVLAALKVRA